MPSARCRATAPDSAGTLDAPETIATPTPSRGVVQVTDASHEIARIGQVEIGHAGPDTGERHVVTAGLEWPRGVDQQIGAMVSQQRVQIAIPIGDHRLGTGHARAKGPRLLWIATRDKDMIASSGQPARQPRTEPTIPPENQDPAHAGPRRARRPAWHPTSTGSSTPLRSASRSRRGRARATGSRTRSTIGIMEGIGLVVSLLERDEAAELGLQRERDLCLARGIDFLSFPVPDRGVPDRHDALTFLRQVRGAGKPVAFHCRAGIGRSSMMAAAPLALDGLDADEAFVLIRSARGVAVPDTEAQRLWVADFENRLTGT